MTARLDIRKPWFGQFLLQPRHTPHTVSLPSEWHWARVQPKFQRMGGYPICHPFPVTTRLACEAPCPTYRMPEGGFRVMTPKLIHGLYRFSALQDDLV